MAGNELEGGKKTPPPLDQAQASVESASTTGTGSTLLDDVMGKPPVTEDPTKKTPPPGTEQAAANPPAPGTTPAPEAQPAATPPAAEVAPAKTLTGGTEQNVLFQEPEAPPTPGTAADQPIPTANDKTTPVAAPTDVLAGVIDPTFKALVDDKSAKMVTHIENGAAFLKQGMPLEATNAYRQAADLVSPEEQKIFLAQEKALQQLIKAETQKPADQQDAKKLEALKELERKTRTLGRVDMFTEVNSGLIWTQAGDMTKASECFARAFVNEKQLIDAKALPPEGYLSKEPNLGARVNEISQRLGVNIWKLMGDSVQRAGVDPKLVGLDTGRGPPVRTEGGGTPQAVPGPEVPNGPNTPNTPANFRPGETPPSQVETTPRPEAPKPEAPKPETARVEQGLEKPVKFSPLDDQSRSPLEQIGFWIDKAEDSGTLTQEARTAIEKAIKDADKGMSPKVKELEDKRVRLEQQTVTFLNAKVGNGPDTVRDVAKRIDESVLGTFEEKPDPENPGQTKWVPVKPGVVDKLLPPADFQASDEAKTATPPADYKPSVAKPADFKGTDEEYRVEQYRSEKRNREYRDIVRSMYTELDTALTQDQYAKRLEALKQLHPDNKEFMDKLSERDQVMTQVRTSLLDLNLTTGKIPAETNQSATARSMYAEILVRAQDTEGAKKYFSEAYAWNQLAGQRDGFRTMAIRAGADPVNLLEAAIKQNQDRGSGNYEKCMRPEVLLQEANLLFASARPEKKAEVAGRLAPSMEKLQKMADSEYAQIQARSKSLSEQYEKALPADPALRTELTTLEGRMTAAEAKFTEQDVANAIKAKNPEVPEGERKAASDALQAAQPEWFKDSKRYAEILGDKAPTVFELKAAMAAHSADVVATGQNVFYSRAILANMQLETKNPAAKATLAAGFAAVPQAARTMLLGSSDQVKELAKNVQLTEAEIKALPEPTVKAAEAPKPPTPESSGMAPAAPAPVEAPTPAPGQDTPTPAPAAPEAQAFKGDPRFAKVSDRDLEIKIREKSGDLEQAEEVKAMYKELIARYDAGLNAKDFEEAIPSMALLTEALKQGKDIKDGPNGTRILSDEPLTPERRWRFHKAIFGDMQMMNEQVRIRMEYAQFLKASGQFKDAETMGLEARDKAEALAKPRQVDGKSVRIVDFMNQEAAKLVDDMNQISDPQKRQEMQVAYIVLKGRDVDSGAIKTPINTNKFLAQLYLGTEIIPKLNSKGEIEGIQDIKFGQSSAFKPQKAIDPAQRALQYTRDILGVDPLDAKTAKENPGVASLFGVLADVLDKPEKYKLYVAKGGETYVDEEGKTRTLKTNELYGKNDAGVPILIDLHSVDNLKKQIKKDSTFDSVLIDAGIAVAVIGTIALSRNPKVAAFFEKSMGPVGNVAGKVVKVSGYVAPFAAIPARNTLFRMATGADESWTDSTVHVVGSLAAAEVGGRLSGRGSFLTGATSGPRQFALMDAKGSAQFLERNNVGTTGELMDLLKRQGYLNEAKAFTNMPRGTKFFDAAGKLEPQVASAFEKAQLTGARTGSIAEAVMKDAKLASGVKAPELTARIAQADAGAVRTVGDLKAMVRNDQRAIQDLARQTQHLEDGVKIEDALKDIATTPNGKRLLEVANRYGIAKVGPAQKLAAETEKLSFSAIFPGVSKLESSGLTVQQGGKTVAAITDATKLTDVVKMGQNVLDGPGLQRLLGMVPAGERVGMLTPAALKEAMAARPLTGDRTVWERMWDGGVATKNGVVSTWNTVTTKQGWSNMGSAVKGTLEPLGTKNFYLKTAPGAVGDATMWTAGKLNAGRKHITDRLAVRAIDPATATAEQLARGRFASGFYGGLGAAGTYNTIVKPYDLTGQIAGMTLPQVGNDGKPHAVYQTPDGEDMTWLKALKESHFPTVDGVNPDELPVYLKWMAPAASFAVGTPGQALFGSMFLKPGAITKPVWSNPEYGNFRKTMQSVSPLSPTRWTNWNAGVFSGPTMATAGVFAGTALPSTLDGVGPRLNVSRYKDLLKNAQRPIENTPLPKQRTSIEEAQEQVQPVQPAPAAAPEKTTPATPADPTKKKPGEVEEPPPPGTRP
jgi:tetratricopeptide (TPR) repeat protein